MQICNTCRETAEGKAEWNFEMGAKQRHRQKMKLADARKYSNEAVDLNSALQGMLISNIYHDISSKEALLSWSLLSISFGLVERQC
jgi:hypothetical protein